MATDRLPDPSQPDAVGRAEFATSFRGFDPNQVRAYLKVVARELQRRRDHERELEARLADAESHLERMKEQATELDEARLTARLGEEAARLLDAARTAAADRRRRAEQEADRVLDAARQEAAQIIDQSRAAADAELERARASGRELIAEARLVRERVLEDLSLRRRSMRVQVEQLRAGRDRLLQSYDALRRVLDDVGREVASSLPEARRAAEQAGERLHLQGPAPVEQLEAEIEAARASGQPIASPEEVQTRARAGGDELADRGVPAAKAAPGSPAVGPAAEPPAPEEHAGPAPGTDEIPVLEHFGAAESDEVVLSELSRRRSKGAGLPREPVPIVPAPDALETVRVFSVRDERAPDEPETPDAPPRGAEPEPGPEVEREPEREVAPAPAPEPAPAPAEDVTAGGAAAGSEVDDLFARIRESRTAPPAGEPSAGDAAGDDAAGDDAAEAGPAPAMAPAATPGGDEELFAIREQALGRIEAQVARKLKRLLSDEQNDVQDLIRRRGGSVAADEVIGPHDHHVGRFIAAVGGELLAAVGAGADFGGGADPAGDPDLAPVDSRLAADLLDPLRHLLTRAVESAGGDDDELMDRVRAAYRETKSQRTDAASRAAVRAAFNLGVASASGADGLVRWVVDPEVGCSPDCEDNALAGPQPVGEPFPTGALYPPAHGGCRCLLAPAHR